MTDIRHPEFRDELEHTNYPFGDAATLTNAAGDFIGESIFLDAVFYVIGAADRLYLSRVVITNSQATLYLGDSVSENVASGSFSLLSPPTAIRMLDAYGRPAGMLVSEPTRLAAFTSWTVGEHEFELGETEFAAVCCVPTPEIGVRGFSLDDGSFFAGDVWLIGEDGVVLRHETETHPSADGLMEVIDQVIRVDIVGDPLFRRRLCEVPTFFNTPKFVRQIVIQEGGRSLSLTPDDYGDVKMTVGSNEASDTVLRIRSTPQGLMFEAVGQKLEGLQ